MSNTNTQERMIHLTTQELELIERIIRVEEQNVAIQKEIKQLREDMNKRFEQIDKRFEQIDKRFSSSQWLIGIGFSAIAIMISVYNFI